MSIYSIQADFIDIESPELIAASLFILQNDGWRLKDYTFNSLKAYKNTVGSEEAEINITISKHELTLQCDSELTENANKLIVDSVVDKLHQFIDSPHFNQQIAALKHQYFMKDVSINEDKEPYKNSESGLSPIFISFFKKFRVTEGIIAINILMLLLMVLTGINPMLPEPEQILKWGGVNRSLVLQGDWWRLITSCFLHYGVIHLAFNMWALYSIGVFLETIIGSWRFLFAYIIAGLAGGLNSMIWHTYGAGAGASGAIFGMFGLFAALLTTNVMEKGFRKSMLQSLLPMILFNLLIGTAGQIDNAAHLGGLFSGGACGYLFAWHFKNPLNKLIKFIGIIIPIILIGVSGYLIGKHLPDAYTQYINLMKKADELQNKAMALETVENPKANEAVKIWDEAAQAIVEAQKLDLTDEMETRNAMLLFYYKKRKQEAILLSSPNQTFLPKVQQSLDSILKALNEKEE